ncbi:LOW QUALITY PROTEIN: complement C1r subcomponent [Pseudophryne corroboree]|uniref:LOW QUALITY PROTEIN: complement C1r subcomponent n=1 Tax=Pseudophryne corroboree TaxID=495146 RepID=UPI003081FFBF
MLFCGLLLFGTVTCSALKRPRYGIITSPNFPKTYPNNNHSTWNIAVPEGYHVSLNFLVFYLEPSDGCSYDYVTVWADKKEMGRFCGPIKSRSHPGRRLFVSQGNQMKIELQSDFSNEENGTTILYPGFQAYYQAVDNDECSIQNDNSITWTPPCQHTCHNYVGGYFCSCLPGYKLQSDQKSCKVECSDELFTEETGVISSPGYPQPYPADLNCTYRIRLEKGLHISLSFHKTFEIDDHPRALCPYDTLKVFAGGSLINSYCGRRSPGKISTQSNEVDIVFQTDESGDSRGWKLHYTSEAVKCPDPVALDEFSIISPKLNAYRMRDYIVVSCRTGYRLMENGKELRSFTSLCRKDGIWHRPMPHCEIVSCESPQTLRNGQHTFLTETDKLTYLSTITYSCTEHFYKMVTHTGSATFTCSEDRVWEDENGGRQIPMCVPVCGRPLSSLVELSRIIKGDKAAPGNFPWQVLLKKSGHGGGGVLIGERWVMTAAHVLRPQNPESGENEDATDLHLFVGDINSESLIEKGTLLVKGVHVHPDYTVRSHNNDIALIELRDPVTMDKNVSPICLPEKSDEDLYESGLLGYVSGFGITERNRISDELRYVKLPVVQRNKCQQYLDKKQREPKAADKIKSEKFTENMFCAGFPEIRGQQQQDSCQGDSGGPFAVPNNDTWELTGLVSWGIGCGKGYGYYTKVNSYIDWIGGYLGR